MSRTNRWLPGPSARAQSPWLVIAALGLGAGSAALHAAPARPTEREAARGKDEQARAAGAKTPTATPTPAATTPALAAPKGVAPDEPTALTAPITAATVYSDSARVARTVRLTLSQATSRLRFPPLCGHVDPKSLRVDVQGHGSAVDVARIEIATPLVGDLQSLTDSLPIAEVKRLIDALEGIEDELARLSEEASAVQKHVVLLSQLTPAVPPLPQNGGKGSPLNPTGWGAGLAFLRSRQEALHQRSHEIDERRYELEQQRQQLEKSLQLAQGGSGWASPHRCWQVTATLHGHGLVDAWLSYRTNGARWEPTYDIQLLPDRGRVELSFAGQVSQSSGEDWDAVALSLSTAVPTRATQLPKLTTWKLGAIERFIPTPNPVVAPLSPPPPHVSPLPARPTESSLRQRLRALLSRHVPSTSSQAPQGADGYVAMGDAPAEPDRDGDGIVDQMDAGEEDDSKAARKEQAQEVQLERTKREDSRPPPPPPPPAPAPQGYRVEKRQQVAQSATRRAYATTGATMSSTIDMTASEVSGSLAKPPVQVLGIGLSPPPGYVPPRLDPRSAAARAGGYDLLYPSLYRESLGSGKGTRRVALFTKTFPVRVLRKIYPALTRDSYLVAVIQNPTSSEGGQPLPGGSARLFVGADPAGHAELGLVAPGERFTLPLGIDRALKPLRNVQLSTEEKGVFSKDEITQYDVVTELANPYGTPIDVQLIDQLPLPGDKNVELKLLSMTPPPSPPESPAARKPPAGWPYADSPYATAIDPETGAVEWRLSIPAGGKIETRFRYTLRRPKGARLSQ
ncbi:MAG: mucoidy inhibitor MuiA family protein [Myxococcales bacterium]|nr:mucoidy inhibitor MuiA family protein [Myxococcales bacterium]